MVAPKQKLHVPKVGPRPPSLTAACNEAGDAGPSARVDCGWSSTDADRGSCGRSGWLLVSTQQVDTQQVQHHQDQHQAYENLLHPQTRVELLLQPGVAGHDSHELVQTKKKKIKKISYELFQLSFLFSHFRESEARTHSLFGSVPFSLSHTAEANLLSVPPTNVLLD